jgi:hypothetical protein
MHMPSIVEVIGAVAQIRDAISSLSKVDTRREFGYPNDHFARIGRALSDIYFPEEGILSVLRKLALGDKLSLADKQRLVEFNQREEPLRNAIENLVLDYGIRSRNSIQQSRIISDIRGRKITLRSAIQLAINEAVTFDKKVPVEQIASLVVEIEALNRNIEQAEHDLRQFM